MKRSIFIFPPEGEDYATNPSEGTTVADVFRSMIPGWSTEECLMNVVTDDANFVLFYDLKCYGEPASPYNRAYEVWAHQGQMTSAIELLRGPVIVMSSAEDTRDCIEQHYLKILNTAKRLGINTDG